MCTHTRGIDQKMAAFHALHNDARTEPHVGNLLSGATPDDVELVYRKQTRIQWRYISSRDVMPSEIRAQLCVTTVTPLRRHELSDLIQ